MSHCLSRKLVFEELQGRLKEKLAKEEKKRKQAREDFASLVRHTRGIEPDTAWEDAESLLQKAPAFTQVRAVSECHGSRALPVRRCLTCLGD